MSQDIVYVVNMHSFKDPFGYYSPKVFRNEKDTVHYACYTILEDTGFGHKEFMNQTEDDD